MKPRSAGHLHVGRLHDYSENHPIVSVMPRLPHRVFRAVRRDAVSGADAESRSR